MNTEVDCVSHIWAAIVITDWFGSKNTVWEVNLEVVISQKDCGHDIHLLDN